VNFIASGFGVEVGVTVATGEIVRSTRPGLARTGARFVISGPGYTQAMTREEKLDHLVAHTGLDPMIGESTITEVLAAYAEGGFSSSFVVTDDSELECLECQSVNPPAKFSMSSLRRLEGASDPADMVAVVALTCPVCGARGTTILGFGPSATAQDAGVLKMLQDDRSDAAAPGNSAPGETTGDDTQTT
jgi:hypothetical protein